MQEADAEPDTFCIPRTLSFASLVELGNLTDAEPPLHNKAVIELHGGPKTQPTHYYGILISSGYYSFFRWLVRFSGVVKTVFGFS